MKVNKFFFVVLFALLYPICPHYFYMFGVSVRDLLVFVVSTGVIFGDWCRGINIRSKKFNRFSLVGIMVWVSINLLVQIFHNEYGDAIEQLLIWLVIVCIGYKEINSRKRFLEIVDILIFVSLFIGGLGIVEEIIHITPFNLVNTKGTVLNYNSERMGIFRIISFTSHAISYCCYCMLMLGVVFYRISILQEKKIIYYLTYLILIMNAFFTMSRSVLLVIVLCQLLLVFNCGYRVFMRWMIILGISSFMILTIGFLGVPEVRKYMEIAFYTVMVLFDERYISLLKNAGWSDNASAIGNRFDLYSWVWESLEPNYLLGKGRNTEFAYAYVFSPVRTNIKRSIEVEWLRTLYRYGIVGLINEIFFFGCCVFNMMKKSLRYPRKWEWKIGFAKVMAIVFICYILVLFAVMKNEEGQLIAILVMLFLAYSYNDGFQEVFYEG